MEQSEQDLLEAVRQLARTGFIERAAAYDRDRAFPAGNVAELCALGIAALGLPKAHGGLGVGTETQVRVMEAIAYGDASTAVALNMHLLVVDFLLSLPPFPRRETVLNDVARNGAFLCAPGSVPTGELDNRMSGYHVTEDGESLRVNGRAGFASMSDGATYVLIGGTIDRGEGAEPDLVLAMPRTGTPGLNILGNWDAMGLRGTASHDVVCEELIVPKNEAVVVPMAMLRMLQEATGQGPGLTRERSRGALGILAIWLGLAQAALDFTVDYVQKRYGYLAAPAVSFGQTPAFRSEEPWAQAGIGTMEYWVGTGRTILYDFVRRTEAPFDSQQAFTRDIVRTIYHLRRMGEEVATGAMRVCGAHAYVKQRPLERIFRDLVGGNVMAWKTDQLVQMLGQGALGMPISIVGPAGA